MRKLPKDVEKLLKRIKVDRTTEKVDTYIFTDSKYISSDVIKSQCEKLCLWFEKQCGGKYIISSDVYTRGEEKQVEFFLRLQGEYKTYLTMIR